MNLQQLADLVAVVDNGLNVEEAAAKLRSSTPRLSTQIRLLEAGRRA